MRPSRCAGAEGGGAKWLGRRRVPYVCSTLVETLPEHEGAAAGRERRRTETRVAELRAGLLVIQ